ncbi:AimR family lysis-lysogeny pheromone receptor [Bacillus sp. Bva_UNVM-123]|uniref:AimR family lysis-lysogeny pheromone receptor n=1 Tax=Bacillus sp. Bva_UNVM-123 TaxID=2829798 RepID=UPI00391EF831
MGTELTLKQMLLNEIDKQPRGYAEELACVAGYSSGSNFTRVLEKEKKEFDKFQGLLNVVTYIWSNEAPNKMNGYAKQIDPNKKTARNMLEYLSSNRQMDGFKYLLDSMDECSNKESKEWSKVYRLQYEHQVNFPNINYDELLKRARMIRTNVIELNVFLNLFKIYCYQQKSAHNVIMMIAEEVEADLDLIENGYIKQRYECRFSEVMSHVSLRVYDKQETSRIHADKVLNSENTGKMFKAFAYFIKGYSYLFSSYDELLFNLNKCLSIYDEMGKSSIVEDIMEKIELAAVYWEKEKNNCKYIKNYLLMNALEGRDIDSLLEMHKNEIEKPFYYYLKGVSKKDNDFLLKSIVNYLKIGDAFLANFAKIELLKNGYDQSLLEDLMSIRAI